MSEKHFVLYVAVFFLAFIITTLTERRLIPLLRQKAVQPIYDLGPSWHHSKGATPTMGGLAFLIASLLSFTVCFLYFWFLGEKRLAFSITVYSAFCILNALIGLFDDLTKLRKNQNAGLTPLEKIFLQILVAVIFLTVKTKIEGVITFDFLIFKTNSVFLYFPISVFIILGIVNCANLTDGIDGLAASVAYTVGISWFLLSATKNSLCAVLSAFLIGSSLSFLIYNMNPAKIFMGDTGSLFFGALGVCCAFAYEKPLASISLGIIYVIEGITVILQVLYFKLTKLRLFKMAPIHHHLEKNGMSENKICLIAVIITSLSSVFTFIFENL